VQFKTTVIVICAVRLIENRARSGTQIAKVMTEVQSRIAARVYLPGARLPSVRAQASAMRMSVSTVVQAYERLAACRLAV